MNVLTVGFLAIVCIYGAAAFIDMRQYRLPDWLTWPAAIMAVPLSLEMGRAYPYMILGLVGTSGMLFFLYKRREPGAGDVKLGLSIGALAGAVGTVLILALAPVVVIFWHKCVRGRKGVIPFGPAFIGSFFFIYPFTI